MTHTSKKPSMLAANIVNTGYYYINIEKSIETKHIRISVKYLLRRAFCSLQLIRVSDDYEEM